MLYCTLKIQHSDFLCNHSAALPCQSEEFIELEHRYQWEANDKQKSIAMLLMTGSPVAMGHVREWEKRKVSFVKTVSGESDVPGCEIRNKVKKQWDQPSLIVAQKRQAEFRKFQNNLKNNRMMKLKKYNDGKSLIIEVNRLIDIKIINLWSSQICNLQNLLNTYLKLFQTYW